jgi:hypothetical protein
MIRVGIAEIKAQLSRHRPPAGPRPIGIDRGMEIPPSFFEPLPDELLEAFEGRHEPS